ncbi:MAG TPA: hypothetical protein PJ982_19375 [Lacipirellulaceae bacterium]|nr:hypothetical protein [Lacipirellulaceae bacterium]
MLALGCSDNGPFQYMPVKGTVLFEDGTPIPAGGILLQFKALDAPPVGDMHPRPAVANVDGQGAFAAATSLKHGDGLIPGRHKVALQYATDAQGKLLIPRDYAHLGTSPLIVETGNGTLDIRVPRP